MSKPTKTTSRFLAALNAPEEPTTSIPLDGLAALSGIKRSNENGSQEDLLMRAQKKRAIGSSKLNLDSTMDEDVPSSPTVKGESCYKQQVLAEFAQVGVTSF